MTPKIRMNEQDLQPLQDAIVQVTKVPDAHIAGFVVMVAVFEDDDDQKPTGRLIASTPNLRTVATMLEIARGQLQGDLDDMAQQS